MAERLVVDPITRIEGHLRVEAQMDGNKIAEAYSSGTMVRGIEMVKPGVRLGDIGHAIQRFAEGKGCSVVREYCGHGIGQGFHEDPQVLHYGRPGTGEELVPGMVFTIEPMVNIGRRETRLPVEFNRPRPKAVTPRE